MLHVPAELVENRLLADLPNVDGERFVASCEPVELGFGEILAEPGAPIGHVYFPIDSLIAVVAQIDDSARPLVVDDARPGALGHVPCHP